MMFPDPHWDIVNKQLLKTVKLSVFPILRAIVSCMEEVPLATRYAKLLRKLKEPIIGETISDSAQKLSLLCWLILKGVMLRIKLVEDVDAVGFKSMGSQLTAFHTPMDSGDGCWQRLMQTERS